MIEIPDSWDTIEEFAQWYKDNNYPIMPPSDTRVYETEVALSTVVFRKGLFQVELYFAKPNMVAAAHSHTADQVSIYLGGNYKAQMGNDKQVLGFREMGHPIGKNPNPDLPHNDYGRLGKKLPAGHWHALSAGPNGFIFCVCEKWDSKEQMYSTFTDWIGEPLGETHRSLINEFTG